MKKIYLFGIILLILCLFTPCPLCAEDEEEESLKVKAAVQLLESMPDFFADVAALKGMEPREKINYILLQSEDRIKEKVADKFEADMKKRITDYTKDAIRARAFLNDAVPKIRNAYAMGESFDWGKIDADLNSKVDTRMNALGKTIDAVKIGYGAYEAYGEEGALGAFKSISAEVYDALAEAYIPGWSYFKMGKEMVQALGRLILDYATDTALEGMLNDMYGLKSNPEGLTQWLIDKSPAAIRQDIQDKWGAGMGFSRVWEGQGTDKGDEAMQGRILDELLRIRGVVLAEKKVQEQKQAALTDRINQYLQKAKDSEAKVKAVALAARQEAKVHLDKIKDFRFKVMGIGKKVAQDRVEAAARAYDQQGKQDGGAISYQPLKRAAVLSALDAALGQIKESGKGGYDQAAYDTAIDYYNQTRKTVLNEGSRTASEGMATAKDAISRIVNTPQKRAAEARSLNCRLDDECKTARQALQAMLEADAVACRPYVPAAEGELQRLLAKDTALLAAEEDRARFEAAERAAKRFGEIFSVFRNSRKRLEDAARRYDTETLALQSEMSEKLHRPNEWDTYRSYDEEGTYSFADTIWPGSILKAIDEAQDLRKELQEDVAAAGPLHRREIEILKRYAEEVTLVKRSVDQAVITNLCVTQKTRSYEIDETVIFNRFSFNTFSQNQLLTVEWSPADGYISFPALKGKTFDEQQKLIEKPPFKAARRIGQLDARISYFEGFADEDRMLTSFLAISNRVSGSAAMKKISERGLQGPAYLEALKAAWTENGAAIRKMDDLRGKMRKIKVPYAWDFYSEPYAALDGWLAIPGKIRAAEKADEEQKKTYALVDSHLTGAKSFLQNPGVSGGKEQAATWISTLNNDVTQYQSMKGVAGMGDRLAGVPDLLSQLRQYVDNYDAGLTQKVRELYDRFKAAYEAKNESLVVSCLADTWQGEGATISDFQKNISRIFRVFDEVRYVISNLRINKTGEGTFSSAYDVTITSRIYKRNIKHEEKSSVSEEVVVDAGGKAKISRTLSGKFWYVQ